MLLSSIFASENQLSELDNLVAWWDASDSSTITHSSGSVSQITDKSGNGHTLTQGTSTAQPKINTETLNGLPVLDFDESERDPYNVYRVFVGTSGAGGGGIVGVSEKTADYTLLTADKDYLIAMNSGSNRQITVDGSLDLPVGGMIHFSRAGTGEVTIVASGATVNSPSGLRLRARHSMATLVCVAADTYLLSGDTKV